MKICFILTAFSSLLTERDEMLVSEEKTDSIEHLVDSRERVVQILQEEGQDQEETFLLPPGEALTRDLTDQKTALNQEEPNSCIESQIEEKSYLSERNEPISSSESKKEESRAQGNPYDTLAITPKEKQKISEILMTMAENNVFQLLFQKKHLERLGHEIHHVHPVRFMGTVFSDPRLVGYMRRIRHSSFKWEGFIDGFGERIKQEIKAGNIDMYIPGLAETLGVKAQDIQAYIHRRDFEGLILYLVEHCKH